jgi:hypothetical protein
LKKKVSKLNCNSVNILAVAWTQEEEEEEVFLFTVIYRSYFLYYLYKCVSGVFHVVYIYLLYMTFICMNISFLCELCVIRIKFLMSSFIYIKIFIQSYGNIFRKIYLKYKHSSTDISLVKIKNLLFKAPNIHAVSLRTLSRCSDRFISFSSFKEDKHYHKTLKISLDNTIIVRKMNEMKSSYHHRHHHHHQKRVEEDILDNAIYYIHHHELNLSVYYNHDWRNERNGVISALTFSVTHSSSETWALKYDSKYYLSECIPEKPIKVHNGLIIFIFVVMTRFSC